MPIFNGRPAQQNIKDIIINIRFTRLFFIQESRQVQVHHGGGEHDELEHGEQAGHGEEGHGGVPHDAGALPGRRQHLHIWRLLRIRCSGRLCKSQSECGRRAGQP